jgi:hypothetical protein
MQDEQAAAGSVVREHDIGTNGSVVIAVEADDVRVRGVDGTAVRLVAPATDHPAIEVMTEPGRYAIRLGQPIRGRVFGFRLGSRGVFGLEVGGGTVELEVPRDARLEISVRSGDVSVRDVTGSVAVRTVSGDVALRGGGGDLRVDAASGSLRAVAAVPITATVRTVSGDVEIDAPRTERTSITTVSGDVEIASVFAPGGDHVVSTTSGDVELAVQGGVTIDVRTVSGDVDCAHPDRRAGDGRRGPLVIGDGAARLSVRTLSGDIEVRAGRPRPESVAAPGVPAAGPAAADPPHTLAVLESLARGEIDVAEGRSVGWAGRASAMADAVGDILQMVADGRLTPAEAAPILDALGARERESGEPVAGRNSTPARIRVQVHENGRVVVDLQVPGILAGLASSLPGIPSGYADRVREALRSGLRGPIIDIRDEDGSGLTITID